MADAQIPSGIRALVVIPGRTGLARDVFVNSFAFERNGGIVPSDSDLDAVAGTLAAFYNTGTGGRPPIANWIGQFASRATNFCQIKVYRMNEAPPRTPHTSSFSLGVMGSPIVPMPNEVALCCSFKSSEQKGPRGRGRVFIGPLNGTAVTEAGDTTLRPLATLQQAVVDAAVALKNSSGSTLCTWSVYSTFGPDHLHPVTDVWCDNEFDTVRKRGERATARITG